MKVYQMNPEGIERMWHDAIAEQVRRHCTPSPEAYAAGGDTLIAAVADWIENPPEWIAAPDLVHGETFKEA